MNLQHLESSISDKSNKHKLLNVQEGKNYILNKKRNNCTPLYIHTTDKKGKKGEKNR